eukprot:evm.model.scf_4361.1 EVM.evm.TU.scf_4361.1   scf_4361:462-920(-)
MVESFDTFEAAASRNAEEGSGGRDLTKTAILIVAPVCVAGVIAAFLLIFLAYYTRHRRLRRRALLRRERWRLGVDALKGEVRRRLVVDGAHGDAVVCSEAIVLEGEWFKFGAHGERTWLCCGPTWGGDLARRGLDWAALHAREPDMTRGSAV